MSVTQFQFTKDWNSSDPLEGFPSIENSEIQARADMQELHDQTRDKINELITDYNGNIPSALTNAEIDAAIS